MAVENLAMNTIHVKRAGVATTNVEVPMKMIHG
jgi:hypothetical protein